MKVHEREVGALASWILVIERPGTCSKISHPGIAMVLAGGSGGQLSPVANSASLSAVFGAHSNAAYQGAPWSPAAPWSPVPATLLAIMPSGFPPAPPQGHPPNGLAQRQQAVVVMEGALLSVK